MEMCVARRTLLGWAIGVGARLCLFYLFLHRIGDGEVVDYAAGRPIIGVGIFDRDVAVDAAEARKATDKAAEAAKAEQAVAEAAKAADEAADGCVGDTFSHPPQRQPPSERRAPTQRRPGAAVGTPPHEPKHRVRTGRSNKPRGYQGRSAVDPSGERTKTAQHERTERAKKKRRGPRGPTPWAPWSHPWVHATEPRRHDALPLPTSHRLGFAVL